MAYDFGTRPVEGRPSLRPLALLLVVLAGAWIAALVMIAIQLT
jgi:hypothetical protein